MACPPRVSLLFLPPIPIHYPCCDPYPLDTSPLDRSSGPESPDDSDDSDYPSTPTPRRAERPLQRPLFFPGPSLSPTVPLAVPSPSVPLTSDQLEYLPQAQSTHQAVYGVDTSLRDADETSQYGDDLWEDEDTILLAQRLEQSYASQLGKAKSCSGFRADTWQLHPLSQL